VKLSKTDLTRNESTKSISASLNVRKISSKYQGIKIQIGRLYRKQIILLLRNHKRKWIGKE
jgi:hypothetical protein